MAVELRFRMTFSPDEAQRYYQGAARFVIVMAENGQKVQFPAEHIRPFIKQSGVSGYFSILFDDAHKLLSLKKIAD
jgi:hypothetical protein